MSTTRDDEKSEKTKTLGFRISESSEEEFLRALRKAQSEGLVPLDANKSDTLRLLVEAFTNNPEILQYQNEENENTDK